MESGAITAIQEQIAEIWCSLLGVSQIGGEQTFFELGGDSLQMIDMLLLLGERLGMEIDPSLIFEDASLQGFARLVVLLQQAGSDQEGVI